MNEKRRKLRARVNRISGQITGIGKMLDEDRYCVDILDQISAARSALDSLGVELLTGHVEGCIIGHGTTSEHEHAKPMSREDLLHELQTALNRFLK